MGAAEVEALRDCAAEPDENVRRAVGHSNCRTSMAKKCFGGCELTLAQRLFRP